VLHRRYLELAAQLAGQRTAGSSTIAP
jgi:hypothetical protein